MSCCFDAGHDSDASHYSSLLVTNLVMPTDHGQYTAPHSRIRCGETAASTSTCGRQGHRTSVYLECNSRFEQWRCLYPGRWCRECGEAHVSLQGSPGMLGLGVVYRFCSELVQIDVRGCTRLHVNDSICSESSPQSRRCTFGLSSWTRVEQGGLSTLVSFSS